MVLWSQQSHKNDRIGHPEQLTVTFENNLIISHLS